MTATDCAQFNGFVISDIMYGVENMGFALSFSVSSETLNIRGFFHESFRRVKR